MKDFEVRSWKDIELCDELPLPVHPEVSTCVGKSVACDLWALVFLCETTTFFSN